MRPPVTKDTLLSRARSGDDAAFSELVGPHRRELLLHCYRILGSFQDAEDVLQETLLSAWRALDQFDGRLLRAWLYRIATNRCMNELRATRRRGRPGLEMGRSVTRHSEDPWWLEPYPDALLDDHEPGPEGRYAAREAIALSFIAALQLLPPRQRAALILRDVLGFDVAGVARMLGATPTSVNSALQRARRDFREPGNSDLVPLPQSPEEGAIVERFVNAFEQGDIDQIVSLLTDDSRFTMPPEPDEHRGPLEIAEFIQSLPFWGGPIKLVPTRANGQPAFGYYVRDPSADLYRAVGLLVVGLREDRICSLTRFGDKGLLGRFGLPRTLTDDTPARNRNRNHRLRRRS
jgi:RNA polymerase sigma-70 factor (TIGR02960 family)